MNCAACNAAGDMVPFLRALRKAFPAALAFGRVSILQGWIDLTQDVIRLKHQECYNYAECTCLHRLPQ